MNNFLDKKEEKYFTYFGKPVIVAHNISVDPHIDVYVFTNKEENQYIYLTKGVEEVGFREMLMTTVTNDKWPVFFFQEICNYQITEKKQIQEMETYDNAKDIKDANGFNYALFLDTSVVGFNKEELKKELGLIYSPLYVFPITKIELEYSLNNGVSALLRVIKDKTTPLGDVNRKSVI